MPTLSESLHAAVQEQAPELQSLLDVLGPDDIAAELDEQATEQLLRAFVALLHEGIDGGRDQRDLVMSTAVPALVASGRTPLELVRAHVRFFMALQERLLGSVPPEQRDEAARWLAHYAGDYVGEVLETASAA